MKHTWCALEHRFYKNLKSFKNLHNGSVYLLVSGGLDSMVLWRLFETFAPILKFDFRVIHFHHGPFSNKKFRDRAQKLVQVLGKEKKNKVKVFTAKKNLKSEGDFRQFRLSRLQQISIQESEALFVSGHHEQDLLETRLHRVFRGTSPAGLQSMTIDQSPYFRPLLYENHADILNFATKNRVRFVSDPTNKNQKYFRNWIRHQFLPALEKRNPGSQKNLNSFFEKVVELSKDFLSSPPENQPKQILQLKDLQNLDVGRQKKIIHEFLKLQVVANSLQGPIGAQINQVNGSHVLEVLKRLSSARKKQRFSLVGLHWQLNAKQLLVCKKPL